MAFSILKRKNDANEELLREIDDLKIEHADETIRLKAQITRLKEQTPSA